jgi:Holliday junction resolvase RusA-like endonuclease
MESKFPPPEIFAEPFSVEFFYAGRPKAKDRGTPRAGKNGGAYIFTSPEVKQKEDFIREEFLQTMELVYPHYTKYLPIISGYCYLEVYFLLPPPDKGYWPGKPHVGAPDVDNLLKLVKDALSGRASGRPPLAFKDDSMNAGVCPAWKGYWNPALLDKPGYPTSPGTHVVIHYLPMPRNPELLPSGEALCYNCGRDDFISQHALKLRQRKCTNG